MSEQETLLFLPPEPLAALAATDAAEDAPVVLEAAVIVPIDLTLSHGFDITPDRLAELAASYDPELETATLNFDHAWGGPSYGACERLWVQDGALWVRYGRLAPEAVEGIRSGRYTRRSAEILLRHPVTQGWYFTGLALLGNTRPAIPGLPPLKLRHRCVVITGAQPQPQKETSMDPTKEPAPPAAPPPPATAPATLEMVQLSADELRQLREGVAIAGQLRARSAELEADSTIAQLGSRVTPAMRKSLRPLLLHLYAQDKPDTPLKLSVNGAEKDVPLLEVLLSTLRAMPQFEALGLGQVATEEDGPPTDNRSADEIALHSRNGITPERAAQLRAKYQENN